MRQWIKLFETGKLFESPQTVTLYRVEDLEHLSLGDVYYGADSVNFHDIEDYARDFSIECVTKYEARLRNVCELEDDGTLHSYTTDLIWKLKLPQNQAIGIGDNDSVIWNETVQQQALRLGYDGLKVKSSFPGNHRMTATLYAVLDQSRLTKIEEYYWGVSDHGPSRLYSATDKSKSDGALFESQAEKFYCYMRTLLSTPPDLDHDRDFLRFSCGSKPDPDTRFNVHVFEIRVRTPLDLRSFGDTIPVDRLDKLGFHDGEALVRASSHVIVGAASIHALLMEPSFISWAKRRYDSIISEAYCPPGEPDIWLFDPTRYRYMGSSLNGDKPVLDQPKDKLF